MAKDINGNSVTVGTRVRVLSIDPRITEHLPPGETKAIQSMVGDALEVYETAGEYAYVMKQLDHGGGKVETHSVSLRPHEMEVLNNGT